MIKIKMYSSRHRVAMVRDKHLENVFFQVREKSGNFVVQVISERTLKIREF